MDKDEEMKKLASLETYLSQKSPFCKKLQDNAGVTLCNHDRSSVGSCNLVTYDTSLPKIYQNFKDVENVKRRDVPKVNIFIRMDA